MASKIKVVSPYMQQNGGDSVLSAIELSSPLSTRELTIELGPTASQPHLSEAFQIALSSSDGIEMSPNGISNELDNIIFHDQRISVALDSTASHDTVLTLSSSNGTVSPLFSDAGVTFTDIHVTNTHHDIVTDRDLAYMHNFNGQEYVVKQDDQMLLDADTSFLILRTNPKLTGNVKVTVDNKSKIWLNSIDAVKELADSRFKKVKVNPNSNYAIDIHKFFDDGKTPAEIVYALHEESASYFSTQRTLDKQHDHFYTTGGYQLIDKMYDEDFAYFAPLKLNKILPEYFVIFKADGAVNEFTYASDKSDWMNHVSEDILNNAKIVKSYDLTERSNIGKYIRNLLNHPAKKEEELTVSFQANSYTSFNGIAYDKGSFAQMGEILSDYFSTPNPLISVEEYLSLGFERNHLITPSILNLEFLFFDEEAKEYEINRYFGLYVSANELSRFNLSLSGIEQFSGVNNQLPIPTLGKYGQNFSKKKFVQTNANGIKLYGDMSTLEYTDIDVYSARIDAVGFGYIEFSGDWTLSPYLTIGSTITVSNENSQFVTTVVSIEQLSNKARIHTVDQIIEIYVGHTAHFNGTVDRWKEKVLLKDTSNRIFYLQDKLNDLYKVNDTKIVQTSTGSFEFRDDLEIDLTNTQIDLSKFTGELEMTSQTEAVIQGTMGHSVAMLEIIDALKEGDSIIIEWSLLSDETPMRWEVNVSTPYLNDYEVWPEANEHMFTDVDNRQYKCYSNIVNTGTTNDSISLAKIADTIKRAFDTFPFKIFKVIASDNKLFFKSINSGDTTNELYVKLHITTNSIRSLDYNAPIGDSKFNFMGGSTRLNNRVRISSDVAKGITEDEWFRVVGSFSSLESYNLWGNKVLYYPSLIDEVYTDDVLVDFSDKSYSMIKLSTDSKFDLTYDDKVTAYNVFKPKLGILSIFPVKDFDNDYFYSDYSKSYDKELENFFKNNGVFTIVNIDYTLNTVELDRPFYRSGEVDILGVYNDGRNPKSYNGKLKLKFQTASTTAEIIYYKGPLGTWDLTSAELDFGILNVSPERLVLLDGDQILYFDESDLSKFKGFLTLSNVNSEHDFTTFKEKESIWSYDRFIFDHVSSEYMRNYENFTTEYALTSKVVPYICKWVSKDKDIRDNAYRLNYNRAFGTMNFTPSSNITVSDTRYHTHEWSYIGNVPSYFDINELENTYSYMFESIDDYDFTSITRDWFIEYFSIGYPVERTSNKLNIDRTERFSTFKYDDVEGKTYTMFRGAKFSISDLVNSENVNQSLYDGYKFASVIISKNENDKKYENPVDFKLIINDKFKFIVNVIYVNLSTYKNPNGNISYVDLYTMQNRRDKATYTFDLAKTNVNILTDVVGFNYNLGIPSDVILNTQSRLTTGAILTGSNITERINPALSGEYSYLYGLSAIGVNNPEVSAITPTLLNFDETRFIFNDGETFIFNPVTKLAYNANLLPDNTWLLFKNFYASGGDNLYEYTRKLLSFFEISKALNKNSDKLITDITRVSKNGIKTSESAIRIEHVQPEKILQTYDLLPVSDTNKPSQLYSKDVIGVEIQVIKDPKYIYRYQGNFSPKFKDLFFFASREDKDFALSHNRDYKFRNTHLLVKPTSYTNRNLYFNKVADEEILNIPLNSGYKSLYPLVDEISIDRMNNFIWNSTWDNLQYQKYSSISNFSTLKGTTEMKENKSFLGSKMMKVPETFELFEFLSSEYSFREVTTSGATKYIVEVNIANRLLRELLGTDNSKAKKIFYDIAQKNANIISPDEVESKCIDYLQKNILPVYDISNVNFYLLETGNKGTIPSENERPVIESMNDKTLSKIELLKKYQVKKDLKVSISNDMSITLEFTPDTRFYTSVGFGINVKRI